MGSNGLLFWGMNITTSEILLLLVGIVILAVIFFPVYESPFLLGATLALGYWLREETLKYSHSD